MMETLRQQLVNHLATISREGASRNVYFDTLVGEMSISSDQCDEVLDILWALITERVLRLTDFKTAATHGNLVFTFTQHGRAWLAKQEPTPYDPDGYLERLRALVENLDPVVEAYIQEGLQAFLHQLPFSATVMVGCAAEQVFVSVEESLVKWSTHNTPQHQVNPRDGVKARYENMLKRLQMARKSLPDDVVEHLEADWCAIFNLIRTARNDAGHPTRPAVDMDDAMASLLTFPRFCERAMILRAWLDSNTP